MSLSKILKLKNGRVLDGFEKLGIAKDSCDLWRGLLIFGLYLNKGTELIWDKWKKNPGNKGRLFSKQGKRIIFFHFGIPPPFFKPLS